MQIIRTGPRMQSCHAGNLNADLPHCTGEKRLLICCTFFESMKCEKTVKNAHHRSAVEAEWLQHTPRNRNVPEWIPAVGPLLYLIPIPVCFYTSLCPLKVKNVKRTSLKTKQHSKGDIFKFYPTNSPNQWRILTFEKLKSSNTVFYGLSFLGTRSS